MSMSDYVRNENDPVTWAVMEAEHRAGFELKLMGCDIAACSRRAVADLMPPGRRLNMPRYTSEVWNELAIWAYDAAVQAWKDGGDRERMTAAARSAVQDYQACMSFGLGLSQARQAAGGSRPIYANFCINRS